MSECYFVAHAVPDPLYGGAQLKAVWVCKTHSVTTEFCGPHGMCPEGRLQRLERLVAQLVPDRSTDV